MIKKGKYAGRVGGRRKERVLSSGEVIARGLALIQKHNPDIMERYREAQRKIWSKPNESETSPDNKDEAERRRHDQA